MKTPYPVSLTYKELKDLLAEKFKDRRSLVFLRGEKYREDFSLTCALSDALMLRYEAHQYTPTQLGVCKVEFSYSMHKEHIVDFCKNYFLECEDVEEKFFSLYRAENIVFQSAEEHPEDHAVFVSLTIELKRPK